MNPCYQEAILEQPLTDEQYTELERYEEMVVESSKKPNVLVVEISEDSYSRVLY